MSVANGPASVLFVCGENAVRSPMAEGILKKLRGDTLYVDSVGVREGAPHPITAIVMQEIGVDLSRHVPKRLADLLDTSFDLIITLTPEAHHQALELTRTSAVEVEYWKLGDPSAVEGSRDVVLAAYRALRDDLYDRIKRRFAVPPDRPRASSEARRPAGAKSA
jgi:protein-tyrosine-phosphatase